MRTVSDEQWQEARRLFEEQLQECGTMTKAWLLDAARWTQCLPVLFPGRIRLEDHTPVGRRSQLRAGASSSGARSCARQAQADSVGRLAFVTRHLPLCSAFCTAVLGVTGVGGPKVAGRCGH